MKNMQKKLVLATENKGKVQEFKKLMVDIPVEILTLADFTDLPEIKETGSTFRENAYIKARTICDHTSLLTLADDSGLEVDALNGEPGIYSARYSLVDKDMPVINKEKLDEENNLKLLTALAGVPWENRTARFVSSIAIALPGGECYYADGSCEGVITTTPRGDKGFGYDPLFYLPNYDCTLAEVSLEIKNKLSHRGKAYEAAKELLGRILL